MHPSRGATEAHQLVLLTARTQPEDRARGLKAGADDYLDKPLRPRVLLGVVGLLARCTLAPTGLLPDPMSGSRQWAVAIQATRRLASIRPTRPIPTSIKAPGSGTLAMLTVTPV